MKHTARLLFSISLFFITGTGAICQENYAANIKTEVSDGDKMLITYDIDAREGARFFNVIILITHNGQKVPANSAYGDYGSKISPGGEKAIVWYYKNDFNGDINQVQVDVFAYKENEPKAVFRIKSISNNSYAPCEVFFTNNSEYANDYKWDFGDPSSGIRNHSFEKEPTHKYEKGGLYTISLVATNTDLGMESTFYYSLEVLEHPPTIADFEYNTGSQAPPFDVDFKDKSINADTYLWDFGDPSSGSRKNTSTSASPSHKYKLAGTYSVSLTATNTVTGLSSTVTRELVLSEPEIPEAGYIFTLSSDYAPTIVVFKNTSKMAESYSWDFGDPASANYNSSSEPNPSHTYAKPGKYQVKLTAINPRSGKSGTFSSEITIGEPPKPPTAGFTIENNNLIPPATISFKNTSVNADGYSWDFGDPASGNNNKSAIPNPTHTYTSAGRYKVELTSYSSVTDKSDVFSDFVIIIEPAKPPVAGFTFSSDKMTAPATVSFKNSSTNAGRFAWDFGDPASGSQNTSSLENPSHTYSGPGTYKVVLISTNVGSGKTSTYSESFTITEEVKLPVALFTAEPANPVAPAEVRFKNNSINAETFDWNFGDPGSGAQNNSGEINPTHNYLNAGSYKVVLKAMDKTGKNTDEITRVITVEKPVEPPVADFSYALVGDVAPVDVSFTNNSRNGDQYLWNFGDPGSAGNESSEANPRHRFANPGNYNVSLEVKNSITGVTDQIIKEIVVVSEYFTFIKKIGRDNRDEMATSILEKENGEYIVLVNEPQSESLLVTIDQEGIITGEKELGAQIFDIEKNAGRDGYMLAGFREPDKLYIQSLSESFEMGEPIEVDGITRLSRDFSLPGIAVSENQETGIVGNDVEAGEPVDFWFQKLDAGGALVPVSGKTFKFIGLKLGNEIIASEDGGFAITGYWQEDDTKPKRLMFATVDRTGKGYLKAITAMTNFIGCDIVTAHEPGYAILAAQGSAEDESIYSVVLMIVDLDGGPASFSGILHEDIFLKDLQKFPPCIIREEGGYIAASYSHNGNDYDINITWIDKSGSMIMKKEVIRRPGDQFVSDIVKLPDGSLMIIGAEMVGNQYDALIIKTDPFGRVADTGRQ